MSRAWRASGIALRSVASAGRSALTAAAVLVQLAACGGGGGDDAGARPNVGLGAAPAAVACGVDVASLRQTVHVSSRGRDVDGCGASTATACASIGKGLAQCDRAGCGVLVRHGLYGTTATIELRDGVSVYGGCRFDGEPDQGYRTTIEASPALGSPAIAASGLQAPTVVRGLVVIGKDETAAGIASIVLSVSRSPGLTLVDNVLVGGRGGDGSPGANAPAPGAAGVPGTAGAAGGGGGASCMASAARGSGGQGGTDVTTGLPRPTYWDCESADRGQQGQPSGDGKPGGALGSKGAYGIACNPRPADAPSDGGPGQPGGQGACGTAAQPSTLTAGRFDGAAWIASRGSDGAGGMVGGGGGGGGAGGACITYTQGYIYDGLPGGGGGAGGCGGGPGRAGQQGGASIPLVLTGAGTPFDAGSNSIVPGPGGRGGRGGDATAGGSGGSGGAGQSEPRFLYLAHWCPGIGNAGGKGGDGGAGSAGAGGHGGPSIGIAVLEGSAVAAGLDAVYAALPGLPGRGGAGGGISPGAGCGRTVGADGPHGVIGFGAAAFDFAAPPGGFLAGGEALAIGQTLSSPDRRHQLVLRADKNLCLLQGSQVVWCSVAAGFGAGNALFMQTDGNLCLYTDGASPACSNTSGHPGAFLLVRDDGRLVVSDGVNALWTRP